MGKFRDVIAYAVSNEIQSQDFYHQVAVQARNPELKIIFEELALEEGRHKEYLEGMLTQDLVAVFFGEVADFHVSETVDKPTLSLEMKPVQAIALAMKNEEEAMGLYQKLATKTQDNGKKMMLLELAKMEQKHKSILEDVYTNMAFVEVWE